MTRQRTVKRPLRTKVAFFVTIARGGRKEEYRVLKTFTVNVPARGSRILHAIAVVQT